MAKNLGMTYFKRVYILKTFIIVDGQQLSLYTVAVFRSRNIQFFLKTYSIIYFIFISIDIDLY